MIVNIENFLRLAANTRSIGIGINRSCRNIGWHLFRVPLHIFHFFWFFLSKFAQAFFFLLSFLFQISLTFFKRVIWFCQDNIPERRVRLMYRYEYMKTTEQVRKHPLYSGHMAALAQINAAYN